MLTTASYAYTQQEQRLCSGDAMRLCGSEIPNISRIAACMHQQRAKLSAGCRAVMDRDDAAARKELDKLQGTWYSRSTEEGERARRDQCPQAVQARAARLADTVAFFQALGGFAQMDADAIRKQRRQKFLDIGRKPF